MKCKRQAIRAETFSIFSFPCRVAFIIALSTFSALHVRSLQTPLTSDNQAAWPPDARASCRHHRRSAPLDTLHYTKTKPEQSIGNGNLGKKHVTHRFSSMYSKSATHRNLRTAKRRHCSAQLRRNDIVRRAWVWWCAWYAAFRHVRQPLAYAPESPSALTRILRNHACCGNRRPF